MSNRCSSLCNHRSFSFCTPLNPYSTTRFPLFPIQHSFILIGRRSRGRSSSVPLKVAAQSSSSDLVLIATQEHHDGSVVFRFGDASEVVENDDAVEDVESQTEQESSVVKVLDGDQDTQVIIKTGDSSVEGRLVEVADGIRNADIGGDIAVSEMNGIRDSSDNNAESSDTLSDVSEKEVLVSQPDANLSDFNNVVESTLDEVKFSVEPSISVELECTQVSKTEVVDYLDNVETEDASKSDTENASSELESMQVLQTEDRKSDTEDISPSAFPTTMAIADIELTDAANEDVEEDSKDMIVNEGTVIVEPPPSNPLDVQSMDAVNEDVEEDLKDMIVNEGTLIDELPLYNPLNVQLMDAVNEDADEESQDMNINEATIIDEMSSSDQVVVEQPTLDEVSQLQAVDVKDQTTEDEDAEEELQDMNINEATIVDEMSSSDQVVVEQPTLDEVSKLQSVDVKDQTMEEELQQVSTVNREENEVAYVMPVSRIEEEVSQPQSTPLDLQDILRQDRNNEIMQVDTETKNPSVSVNLEANEVMDVTQPYAEDESRMVESKDTSEGDTQELLSPATMHISDVDGINERLQDVNIGEGAFTNEMPTSDPLGADRSLQVSTTKDMDVKDVDMDEMLKDNNIIVGTFIDEITSDLLGAEPTLEVSTTEDVNVKDVDTEEMSQDMNVGEGTFVYEMPTSDPVGAEPTLEVSTTEGLGVKDLSVEAELQLVSNDNMDDNSNEELIPAEPIVEEEEEASQPCLVPVELKATMKDSDIKLQDGTVDDEILQVIGEDADDSYNEDVEESSHKIESQTLQDEGVNHDMSGQCAETDAPESSILLKQGAHDPLLEAEITEGLVGSSELAEASYVTASLLAAEAEVEREDIYLTDDILLSGAALLEHPFKALTGGDDAYFVADGKWLGVANGVSEWSLEGTGPGVYAQELMRTCEEIVLDTSNVPLTNPVELLCRGVKETNMSGSANVLIANFNGQALHVANIGDTGFLIIRHGAVYKKSSPLLHEFHFAVQVDDSDDPLQLVEEHLIELEVGDIVVSATDGLFDNLYEREITMIVSKSLQAGMKPQEIANILATRAQEVGKSSFVRSPFSDAAQAAGYTGYAGGKPDNVAVIVSLVEKRSNFLAV